MFEGLVQPAHLLIILVIVLIVFGPGKLPEVGAALGKTIREVKRGMVEEAPADPSSAHSPDRADHQG